MPEREAISYDRFSDHKQGTGDSVGRQSRGFTSFCTRHKLKLDAENLSDHGKSGFKGTHRTKGALGRFEKLVKAGEIPRGKVLVIEAWDRLSRERPDKVIALISSILTAGVDIGVTRLDDIFTEDDLGSHKFTTLSIFVQLAHQESKQKSERVAESWKRRRMLARANKTPTTTAGPAWVEFRGGNWRLVPERAAVVKRIFDLAAAGYGHTRIVRKLTEEGVKPFGERKVSKGRTRSRFSGVWTRPYIAWILNDRRAVGEYQPRNQKNEPEGEPIMGYFPAAVEEREYLLARVGADKRRIDRAHRGTRQRKYVNVFQSLLRNSDDGEIFHLHNMNGKLSLATASGRAGRGTTVTFPYAQFETEILSRLKEIDPAELSPGPREANRLDVLRAELREVNDQIEQLTADVRKGYSAALSTVLREQEAKQTRIKEEIATEEAKAANPAERDWTDCKSLVEMLATADDPIDVRLRLHAVLRRRISEIWLRIVTVGVVRLCAVQVWFEGDKTHRDYLIRYRPAGRGREEQLQTRDTTADALDLRDPEQARQLAEDLAALELDD